MLDQVDEIHCFIHSALTLFPLLFTLSRRTNDGKKCELLYFVIFQVNLFLEGKEEAGEIEMKRKKFI
jgi:hypothetical protein